MELWYRESLENIHVGINDVTNILKFGEEVEVDATNGVVRRLGLKVEEKKEEEKKE